MPQDINQRMAKGIVWMVAARLMDRSIGIVSTLILARLLVPGDFGLVAMATAIGGILDLLGAFSFDMALIQNANAERRHFNTVWTFNVIFGVFCTLALIALAIPAANFYHEPRLTPVIYVLSISYFVGAFGNIGVVTFRKELQFKQEFIFIFVRRVITFIVTITAAFLLRSYWALLLGMTVGRLVSFVMSYKMNDYRPGFTLSAAKELFHFSKWLLVNNALFFLLHDGCTFIIGRLFGVAELGIYSVAYEVSSLPSTELVAPINRATFPGFSKMKDVSEMASAYLKLMAMIALIIVPVGVGIAAVADPLVNAVLGVKWIGAIPLIQILALHGAIAATQGNNSPVWMALGRPREMTVLVAIFLLFLFPGLYFFMTRYGIIGAGYAYLFANVPTLPYGMVITKRLLKFTWGDVCLAVWRPLVAVICMYGSVLALDRLWRIDIAFARLMIESLFGVLVYATAVVTLWLISGRPAGAEKYCLDKLGGMLPPSLRKQTAAPRS